MYHDPHRSEIAAEIASMHILRVSRSHSPRPTSAMGQASHAGELHLQVRETRASVDDADDFTLIGEIGRMYASVSFPPTACLYNAPAPKLSTRSKETCAPTDMSLPFTHPQALEPVPRLCLSLFECRHFGGT